MTAGNASGQNDGAAICIVTHARAGRRARACGRSPGSSPGRVAGVAPETMGIGPVPAATKALERRRARRSPTSDLIELNEAFAAQVLAVHPRVGASPSGLRADERQRLGHLARPPGRRDRRPHPRHPARARWTAAARRYGLETMCIGGGQGLAAVFERV